MNPWVFRVVFILIGLVCIIAPIILIVLYTVIFPYQEQYHKTQNQQLINNVDIKWRNVHDIWPTCSDLIKDCDLLGDSHHTCMKFPEEHQYYKLKFDSEMYHPYIYLFLFLYATSTQPHVTLLIYDDKMDRTWPDIILNQLHQQQMHLIKTNQYIWYAETQARVQPNDKHWTTGIRDWIHEYVHWPNDANIKSWYNISKEKWEEIKALPDEPEKIYQVDQVPKMYHAWFLKAHFKNKIQIVASGDFKIYQTLYNIENKISV